MNDFIAIDFETATQARKSAISIGLVKYRDFKPISSYYSLIRPPRLYILPYFTEIHGLTTEDVKDAPNFGDIWEQEIRGFINDTPLAAHNASFDMSVLRAALEHYGIAVPGIAYFCSLALARQTLHGLPSYSLATLAEHFGITYAAHNALADAKTCGKIIGLCAKEVQTTAKTFAAVTDMLCAADVEMNSL